MTLTAPAPSSTSQTINASALTSDNVGDRIHFTQDNGWRGGIATVNGTLERVNQYRSMFEMARLVIDGELYAVRYATPVTVERAAGRAPMRAAYVPPAPKASTAEPRTVLSGVVLASALPRRLGWHVEARTDNGTVSGVITDAYRDGAIIVARIGEQWGELDPTEPVVVSRLTADDSADPE